MKLIHSTANTLSDREFTELGDSIISAMYDIDPDIRDLFEIHINMVNDEWQVDFVPIDDDIPVIKVDAYTSYDDRNREILLVTPRKLDKFPDMLSIQNYDDSIDIANKFAIIGDYVTSLYDFEYRL